MSHRPINPNQNQVTTPNSDTMIKKRKSPESPSTDSESKIQVVIRCRNRAKLELTDFRQANIRVPEDSQQEISYRLNDSSDWTTYSFDRVFTANTSQNSVFEEVATPILNQVLEGYSCTLFAYGQTGTGKTYTMEGNLAEIDILPGGGAGIIPRVLHRLFDSLEISSPNLMHVVKLSMMEIYNEEIYDLLARPSDKLTNTKLLPNRDAGGNLIIKGLTERILVSAKEGIGYLRQGSANRQKAATMLNVSSSRSHSIFTLTIQTTRLAGDSNDGSKAVHRIGKLNLVDLAGSEDIGRSGAIDVQAKEAGKINQSLLALGKVISRLSKNSKSQTGQTPIFPIYRESKLTRILEDSLGGGTRTCIIATVSLTSADMKETISTLKYASQAKNITNRPRPLVVQSPHILYHEYREENIRLKDELQLARNREGVYLRQDHYQDLLTEVKNLKENAAVEAQRLQNFHEENRLLASKVQSQNRELVSAHQELSKYKEDLNNCIFEFNSCKEKLNVISLELQREQEKNLEHVSTEEKLDSCAKSLYEAAKIRDKTILDLESGIAEFRNSANVHNLKTQAFASETDRHLDQLDQGLKGISESIVDLTSDLEASLLSIWSGLDKKCRLSLEQHLSLIEPAKKHLLTLEANGKDHLNKMNSYYDQLLSQTKALEGLFKPRLDAAQRKLQSIRKKSLEHTLEFNQLIAEKKLLYATWANDHQLLLRNNFESNSKFLEEKQSRIDSLYQNEAILISNHQKETIDFLDSLDKESSLFIEQIMNNIKLATEKLHSNFREQRSKLSLKHTEQIETLRNSVDIQANEVNLTLVNIKDRFNEHANQHSENLSDSLKQFHSLGDLAIDSMSIQYHNSDYLDHLPSQLNEMHGTLNSFHMQVQKNSEIQFSSLSNHVSQMESAAHENFSTLQNVTSAQSSNLASLLELISKLSTNALQLQDKNKAIPSSFECLQKTLNSIISLVNNYSKDSFQFPKVTASQQLKPYPSNWPRSNINSSPPTSNQPSKHISRSRPSSSLASTKPSKIPRFNSHSHINQPINNPSYPPL